MKFIKKIFPLFLLLGCVNTYSMTEHFIEIEIAPDELNCDMVVAFLYDTTIENGPGAAIFYPNENPSGRGSYVRRVSGPSITLKQASVRYGFIPYRDYTINESCKNIDLQSIDSPGLYIAMHVDLNTASINCTTIRVKQPSI